MRWRRLIDWSWCENIGLLVVLAGIAVLAYNAITYPFFLTIAGKTIECAFAVWLPLRLVDALIYGPQRRERERTKAALMQDVMRRS